ncbi:unnamed protein product [Gongylonema pulchrum]|uniref:PHM7_cyt domain-containing protein n=1 Tax=Gongylonema pulchrum TaxID=637853 RepID=A0A183E562_9BILA|nr:unnamed protein product [Gongylonema pulchrum]
MTDVNSRFQRLFDEWRSLRDELKQMEGPHASYLVKLREVSSLQEECQKAVKHGFYRLSIIKSFLKRSLKLRFFFFFTYSLKGKEQPEHEETLKELIESVGEMDRRLRDMKGELPVQDNGLYLSIILGSNLNVSLMNKNDRYRYKQEYEKFKVTVNCTLLFLIFFAYIFPFRLYLSIILGSNLNVSLMNKNDRYRYKQEYEKFKVTVNCTLLFLIFFAYIFPFRMD